MLRKDREWAIPMSDKTAPATPVRSPIWRLTLTLPPLLWGLGFLLSLFSGCNTSLAALKATAYSIAGLAGWLVYLLVFGRTNYSRWPMAGFMVPVVNVSLLNPTREPWPFGEMLTHGLVFSVLYGSMVGLLNRRLLKGTWGRPACPHSLVDAEIDGPVPGH